MSTRVFLGQSQPDFMNDTGREEGRWQGGEETRGHRVLSMVTKCGDLVINKSLS